MSIESDKNEKVPIAGVVVDDDISTRHDRLELVENLNNHSFTPKQPESKRKYINERYLCRKWDDRGHEGKGEGEGDKKIHKRLQGVRESKAASAGNKWIKIYDIYLIFIKNICVPLVVAAVVKALLRDFLADVDVGHARVDVADGARQRRLSGTWSTAN